MTYFQKKIIPLPQFEKKKDDGEGKDEQLEVSPHSPTSDFKIEFITLTRPTSNESKFTSKCPQNR